MKRFKDQAKQIVLNVLEYLDKNQDVLEFKKKRKTELVAEMLRILERSVYRLQKSPGVGFCFYNDKISVPIKCGLLFLSYLKFIFSSLSFIASLSLRIVSVERKKKYVNHTRK
ncbi:hypothetical protein, partial [Enterobacter cloacae complex sp. 2DZ2F20B]|uniref:hypothetical protein n=1 Tax=Enterobacter cloacae complex sp. 2DZ2F20B TaxID=2511993 RepID=UPI001CA48C2C